MPRKPAPTAIATTILHDKTIGVIGLGQIGGSIIRRLMAYRPAITVYGMDSNTRIAGRVRRYCRWSATLNDMVRVADIIILAVPVPAILTMLPKIAESIDATGAKRLLVTDTGTVKRPIRHAAQEFSTHFDYVGIHPLCGTERNGWESARADLFVDQTIICCGDPGSMPVETAIELIACLGGNLLRLDEQTHDRYVALTIGLPHALAYAANATAQQIQPHASLVSGSWHSLVRVTASDADMVAGFLTTNIAEQRRVIAEYRRQLDRLEKAMDETSSGDLASLLDRWRSPHRS